MEHTFVVIFEAGEKEAKEVYKRLREERSTYTELKLLELSDVAEQRGQGVYT